MTPLPSKPSPSGRGQGEGTATRELWTSSALASATSGRLTAPFAATGVSIDTRTLVPGDLFVALVGDSDGHAHAEAALDKGAAGVLIHRADAVPATAPALVVDDTLAALHAIGAAGRARFTGCVIAITGSVGKTTTKEMLRAALAPLGATHAAEASYNNHWGVPLTLARLPPDAAFCVAEIGMNNPGEIEPLARLVRPHVAVITSIAAAHIGHLGSLEAIADEKAAILRGLEPGGVAVLPADTPLLPRLRTDARTVTFGRTAGVDIHLAGETVSLGGRDLALALAAPGEHMALNAAAALATLAALGLDPQASLPALCAFRPLRGRGLQRRLGPILLLDESYNANGASVRAALGVLRDMPGARRLAILGDMLELGEFAPAEHAGLAQDVAASADLLYACGPLMRHLFEAVPPRIQGALAPDSATLAPIVADAVQPGDAVLVKGSLGTRMRVIVDQLEERLA